ncbi:MAG: glycogen synthase [Verrucomicrobia bacterium]|nr:glycogen synthase [Verrucomicrobiota bacterium]
MKIAILTNEYPPYVYGGAGVHVEYLTRELAALDHREHEVQIFCFGDQRKQRGNLSVRGVQPKLKLTAHDPRHEKFLDTILRDIVMAGLPKDVDIVHCHTWYSHFAGCLVKQLCGASLVLTSHSLEPHRPWKAEQLGTAYHGSSWIERTAYQNADGVVAVSKAMKKDVHDLYGVPFDKIRVIHNGIDLNQYKPTRNPKTLREFGIDPDAPYIFFVGRVTRQKGIVHLVNAIKYLRPGIQVVLHATAPDTEEMAEEMKRKLEQARSETTNRIIWLADVIRPREKVIHLYTHAAIFVCPSVYEPFGIINLEAMACETPVVASAVGGIPEVVEHGETGLLVFLDAVHPTNFEPLHPEQFARDLAATVNNLLETPDRMRAMGMRARKQVEEHFSWTTIARQTLSFYRKLLSQR